MLKVVLDDMTMVLSTSFLALVGSVDVIIHTECSLKTVVFASVIEVGVPSVNNTLRTGSARRGGKKK